MQIWKLYQEDCLVSIFNQKLNFRVYIYSKHALIQPTKLQAHQFYAHKNYICANKQGSLQTLT